TSFSTTTRFLTAIELPRQQIAQLSYVQTPTGPQILFQLRGPLLRSRRADAAQYAPVSEINRHGAFYGRVYQDVNLNGRFDPGTDVPQSDVQVRVDGNFYAVSDRNGEFRVDNVRSGDHTVYLDLLTVRADLTLLDSYQQAVLLQPGQDTIIDFRLVRTGRVRGVVWRDVDSNGRMDGDEKPLSDVRVVTASGRDTLTDSQGEFILGDLPPGEHILLIDEKTLPDGTRSATPSIQVRVKAGGETGDVMLPVIEKRSDINVKRFPSSGS
ncbi:MAG TPA: carboxypeptidase-like regulatory domain-containing protein, partial [Blastocatellia bacterium]|nr:carboxypeptidase-like regulatory domain-containing protein [Blastocatellia bacterium]